MPFNSQTAVTAGRKGGRTTKRLYGVAHLKRAGRKGKRIQEQRKKLKA